jgi:hypothetical protein
MREIPPYDPAESRMQAAEAHNCIDPDEISDLEVWRYEEEEAARLDELERQYR